MSLIVRKRSYDEGISSKDLSKDLARKDLGIGDILVSTEGLKFRALRHKDFSIVRYSYLLKMYGGRKELKEYIQEVEKCLFMRVKRGDIRDGEDVNDFCVRQNRFPFRKTTVFDSNRAMFVFCNPSFRHSKSCTDISWIVKIMDYRLDRNNEFVFPINTIGGMENIAIGMAFYWRIVSEIPWVFQSILPVFLDHREHAPNCMCEVCHAGKMVKHDVYVLASSAVGQAVCCDTLTKNIGRQVRTFSRLALVPPRKVQIKILYPPSVKSQADVSFEARYDEQGNDLKKASKKTASSIPFHLSSPMSSSLISSPRRALKPCDTCDASIQSTMESRKKKFWQNFYSQKQTDAEPDKTKNRDFDEDEVTDSENGLTVNR